MLILRKGGAVPCCNRGKVVLSCCNWDRVVLCQAVIEAGGAVPCCY
jgi:hypothetical protein